MKKILLLYCLLISNFSYSQTSVYHPFPDSNAVWNTNFIWFCSGGGMQNDFFSTTIQGEILINAISYHHLYIPYWQQSPPPNCGYQKTGYIGGIRQDIATRKVYFIPTSGSGPYIEFLLYNFNLQVGDTLGGYFLHHCGPYVVASIDSVLIGPDYRKRWNMEFVLDTAHLVDMQIIEGIGSTEGVFETPCISQAFDAGEYKTACFRQEGITLYLDSNIAYNCNLITSIPIINSANVSVNYLSNNLVRITLVNQINNDCELVLFNINGNKLLQKKFNDGEALVDLSNYSDGIYFYKINSPSNSTHSGRIIKY